jgi:DNA-binding NtrC family response regulator
MKIPSGGMVRTSRLREMQLQRKDTTMKKILIIEASGGIRNTLRERLEQEQYTVKTAINHEIGFILMEKFRPDVVLIDSICEHEPPIEAPFIVISDSNTVEEILESVRAGAQDFIPVPIDMNQLLESINMLSTCKEQ